MGYATFLCARLTAHAFVGNEVGESHDCGDMRALDEDCRLFDSEYSIAVVVYWSISSRSKLRLR